MKSNPYFSVQNLGSSLIVGFFLLLIGCTLADQITQQKTLVSTAPDQILYNGKIVTVDEEFSIQSAIAIRGERILAVGDKDQILALADENTVQTDLEGRTVIPGIIDNHLHYLRGTNYAAYETRIQGMTSRQQVLDTISARAQELDLGEWIFIIGAWNEQQFTDKPGGFTREELDAAAPKNPVYMQRSYASFYLNQLAADILREDIGESWFGEDGMIQAGIRSGRPVMVAALKYFPFSEDIEGRMDEVRTFNDYLNSLGLTTVYDAGYLDGSYRPVETLYQQSGMSVRVFYAARYWAETARTSLAAAEMLEREQPFQRDDFFGMFGIGEHVHGLLHDTTTIDKIFEESTYEQWGSIIRSAAEHGWYVNEHAQLDPTASRMLDISEAVSQYYPIKDLRWSLGHADLVSEDTVLRAKELGWNITIANHTVKPVIKGIASPDIRMIQDSGILWGMGSDGTIVATYNPFHTIWEYTAGKVFPNIVKYSADEVITREEALIAHTRSNAYIMFMEDKVGTLEAGKYADLVVLDRDYMTIPIDEIRDIQPVLTMLAGKVVYLED